MATAALATAASKRGIRLGGPVFLKSEDPGALAREHRRLGYSAAYCPSAKVEDKERIAEIERAFAAENVVIAEVGAWCNMLDPDAEKRRKNLEYVAERLALADAVGARCCVNIAGSYNPKVWYGPHPRNLSQAFMDATVQNCRTVIDRVRPKRTTFTIEMMPWSLPDGPASYLTLLKAVDRRRFAVHLDVCNGLNSPQRLYRNTEFIAECFLLLGPWIASCHAKDLHWDLEYNVHFREVGPGQGQVDYHAYLHELSKLPREVPLMLEHLPRASEYVAAAEHIRGVGKALGLAFA
jgi:sugar phosphate isomerase/epimerase